MRRQRTYHAVDTFFVNNFLSPCSCIVIQFALVLPRTSACSWLALGCWTRVLFEIFFILVSVLQWSCKRSRCRNHPVACCWVRDEYRNTHLILQKQSFQFKIVKSTHFVYHVVQHHGKVSIERYFYRYQRGMILMVIPRSISIDVRKWCESWRWFEVNKRMTNNELNEIGEADQEFLSPWEGFTVIVSLAISSVFNML